MSLLIFIEELAKAVGEALGRGEPLGRRVDAASRRNAGSCTSSGNH